MNPLTRKLASSAFGRQVGILSRADRAGNLADRMIRDAIQSIIDDANKASGQRQAVAERAARIWAKILQQVPEAIAQGIASGIEYSSGSLLLDLKRMVGAGLGLPPTKPPDVEKFVIAMDDGGKIPIIRMNKKTVDRLVYQTGWEERFAKVTKAASPRDVARAVAQSMNEQESTRQLAKRLVNVTGDYRGTAKRIARHETIDSSRRLAQESYDQLGDMIVGYQVHAVLDTRTRPEHRKRNGYVYWVHPKAGQKGLDEQPHPPYEADGSVSFNCRCFISPVLNIDQRTNGPQFDAHTASLWFDGAPPAEKINTLGIERYELLKKKLGRQPNWNDAIDSSGELISTESLRLAI